MRALGVLSDKKIIEHCLLDLDKHKDNLDFFIPSIHDSNNIFSQSVALKYIATFTKSKTIAGVHDILMNYFCLISVKIITDRKLILSDTWFLEC